MLNAAVAALRVGVRAGQPADRQHREPVRDLDHVARRPDAVLGGAHALVDHDRAGGPDLQARGRRQPGARDLVQADDHGVALELAGGGLHRAHAVSSPMNASTLVPKRSVTPRLVSDSCTGSATSGSSSSDSAHGPSSTKSTCRPRWARLPGHLDADRRAAEDDDLLHRVQFLVELHRGADVLDVVQPVEVGARDARLLPRPAGADRELVEALVGVARGHRAAVEVDVGDRRLHPHVEPVLDVALDGGEEQRLELVDLAAVDERDAARRVRDVRELGEERDLEAPGSGAWRSWPSRCPRHHPR